MKQKMKKNSLVKYKVYERKFESVPGLFLKLCCLHLKREKIIEFIKKKSVCAKFEESQSNIGY